MGSMVLIRMNVLGKFGINNMPEALVDPDYGQSFEPNRSAFAYGVRDEHPNGTLFDWLRAHVSLYSLYISVILRYSFFLPLSIRSQTGASYFNMASGPLHRQP